MPVHPSILDFGRTSGKRLSIDRVDCGVLARAPYTDGAAAGCGRCVKCNRAAWVPCIIERLFEIAAYGLRDDRTEQRLAVRFLLTPGTGGMYA